MKIRLAMMGTVLWLCGGCLGTDTATGPGNCGVAATATVDVGDTGPYRVGYRTIETTYTPEGETEPRTIPVNVWYPTQDAASDDVARYRVVDDEFGVIPNASLAEPLSDCGFPLLAFSHGDAGWGGIGAHMMVRFASHGWVGVAPDHLLNTLDTQASPRPALVYLARPQDLSASIDVMGSLPEDDPLYARVATDRVMAAGHSFGAFTMWSVLGTSFDPDLVDANCSDPDKRPEDGCTDLQKQAFLDGFGDDRIVGAIMLDNALPEDWMTQAASAKVTKPVLWMTGTVSKPDSVTTFTEAQAPDLTWLEFAGGCHETFAGAIWLGCETFDVDDGYDYTDTYALAFARVHVLGDQSSDVLDIVEGRQTLSPLVRFQRK